MGKKWILREAADPYCADHLYYTIITVVSNKMSAYDSKQSCTVGLMWVAFQNKVNGCQKSAECGHTKLHYGCQL